MTSENEEEAGKEKQGRKQEEEAGERARVTAPAPGTDLVAFADSVTATPINATAPKPFCDDHPPGKEDPGCRRCWDARRNFQYWLNNTVEGLAHQRGIAVLRAGTWIGAKGQARDRQLLDGVPMAERAIRAFDRLDKKRDIKSGRVIDSEVIDDNALGGRAARDRPGGEQA